ncbi:peptidase family M13 [Cooperia oncophora]
MFLTAKASGEEAMQVAGALAIAELLRASSYVKKGLYDCFEKAYKQQLAKNAEPDVASLEGFTNDQLLFLAFSLNSCTPSISDLTLYSSLNSVHAPGMYRVNTVLSHFPPFAEAFFCSPKAEMNKGEKCSLW